jgi:hypothetical protein
LTAGCFLVLEFGWMFLSGRRWLVEWLMFMAMGYFCSGRRLNWRMIVVGGVVLGFVFLFFFPLFLNIRYLYQAGIAADENAILRFFSVLMQALSIDRETANALTAENLSDRPLIHRFICEILAGQRGHPLMMGEALLSTILWAIPSALLTSKLDLLQAEQFIQDWYGMPLVDTSITWPAVGCADFGIAGGFIVGLLVGLILLATQWLSMRLRRGFPFLAMCLLGGMMHLVFNVECDPTVYWLLFRNLMILGSFAMIIQVVATAGTRRPNPGN